ncbi:hypothetical protein, partial [Streptomyces albireticuli]
EPAPTSASAPRASEFDQPVPYAPEVEDDDGRTTYVIFTPSSGYSTHRPEGDTTGSGTSTPERAENPDA